MPLGLKGDPARGSSLYQTNCSACHGQTGNGGGARAYFIDPKPRNFLLDASRRWLNRPILFRAIVEGRPGTEMPAWGKVLNDQEIADIAEFVFRRYTNPGQLDKGSGNSKK
jgi:mono/diheme cytochrome c family protein